MHTVLRHNRVPWQGRRTQAAAERDWLAALNPAQRVAATYGEADESGVFRAGPLLIIAGAGTGKTNTLAHRVAHLILNGVAPERLLLLTFSRRAAQEMIQRAQRIVAQALAARTSPAQRQPPAVARLAWAGTFHSVANRLLRHYAAQVGLEPAFSVMDRGDAADLIDLARQDLSLSRKEQRFPRKDTCLAIYSHCVNTRRALERTLADVFPWCAQWHDELKRLFARYVDMKLRQQVLDFDDLLLYWHALVEDTRLAQDIGALFDHVLVDEYQDTNTLQAEILLALKPTGAGVCVVGDDAQSIYSFSAATVENILGFPGSFAPRAEVVTLEQNYRSTPADPRHGERTDRRSAAAVSEGAQVGTHVRRPAAVCDRARRSGAGAVRVRARAEGARGGHGCSSVRPCSSEARITATCWSSSSCEEGSRT